MSQGTADRVTFNVAAHTALRVMIASYFLAVALTIIPGTDLSLLFAPVLPAPYSGATAAGLVFIFSFMIMIGMATRVAALIIALMTFYASYLTMIALGVENELGSFWRDIALIAALLLTYSEPELRSRRRRRLIHRNIVPRRVNAILARAAENCDAVALARPNRKAKHGAAIPYFKPADVQLRDRSEATPVARPMREATTNVPTHAKRRMKFDLDQRDDVGDDDCTNNIFADDWLSA